MMKCMTLMLPLWMDGSQGRHCRQCCQVLHQMGFTKIVPFEAMSLLLATTPSLCGARATKWDVVFLSRR